VPIHHGPYGKDTGSITPQMHLRPKTTTLARSARDKSSLVFLARTIERQARRHLWYFGTYFAALLVLSLPLNDGDGQHHAVATSGFLNPGAEKYRRLLQPPRGLTIDNGVGLRSQFGAVNAHPYSVSANGP
jgi:hypothetical protein